MKQRVLFVSLHNAARSQMAEALTNYFYGDAFEAHSAGLEPQKLNLLAVEVMRQQGIDIAKKKSKWVYDFIQRTGTFQYVITLCDEQNARRCPLFPGKPKRFDWPFPDLGRLVGSPKDQIAMARSVRNALKEKIDHFYAEALGESKIRSQKGSPGMQAPENL